jgi:hypothetical protein
MAGIPVRDLKQVLLAVHDVLSDPGLATRLLQLCERNERALEAYREQAAELACLRSEHDRQLAETRRKLNEELRVARAEWADEESRRRKLLELDEWKVGRLRERLVRAEQAVAVLRCELPGEPG